MAKTNRNSSSNPKHKLTGELESSIKSIGATLEGNSKIMEMFNNQLEETRATLSSVGQVMGNTNDLAEDQIDVIREAMEGYAKMQTQVAKATRQYKLGKKSLEQYSDAIKESIDDFDELKSKISAATKDGARIVKTFDKAAQSQKANHKATEKTITTYSILEKSVDQLADKIPLLSEMTEVFKNAKKPGAALTASLFAMGAAAGSLAYNLGLIPGKLETAARYDAKLAISEAKISRQKTAFEMGMELDANNQPVRNASMTNFASEKVAANFATSLKQAENSFQAAAKTARFGEGLGPFGFDMAELNLAGISAESISKSMSDIATKTGQVPSQKFAENMALVERRTGTSVSALVEGLMRVDGLSEDSALNMVEGIRDMAKSANVDLAAVMQDIEESQENMLSLGIRSTDELAKQVTYTRSMGLSFDKIASAGKNMVLNYRDSIKSEMKLSSMLGRQVDLSEVRSAFAAGGPDAVPNALKALKAQGLDPESMNLFQQQALGEATGLDMVELQKIFKGEGKSASDLKGASATDANQAFLTGLKQTELKVRILDDSLSNLLSMAITDIEARQMEAYQLALASHSFGIYDAIHENHILEFQKTIHTGFLQGVVMLVGGLIGALMSTIPQLVLASTAASGPGGILKSLGGGVSKFAKVAGISAVAGLAGNAISSYGGSMQQDAKESGDVSKLNSGKLLDVGGTALQGAAIGATIGSIIPGVGTAIGGVAGGIIGAGIGVWDNWFSDDAVKIQEEAAKEQTDSITSVATDAVSKAQADAATAYALQSAGTLSQSGIDKDFAKGVLDGIQNIDANTKAIKELTHKIELLAEAQLAYSMGGNVVLKVDGKQVSKAVIRSDSKNRNNLNNNKNKFDTFYSAI